MKRKFKHEDRDFLNCTREQDIVCYSKNDITFAPLFKRIMRKTILMRALVCLFTVVAVSSCSKDGNDDKENEIVTTEEDCRCSANDKATVLKVGADKPFKTISEVSVAARNHTIIEIDAGTYKGDAALAFWNQDSVVIRASGGEVTLDADGKSMEDKAIWVIDGGTICVEGITFVNAKVPDQNGAGIRLTNGNLTVINCRFLHNEMGLLTGNLGTTTLTVKNSEFGYSGHGDGLSHDIYVGHIGSFYVSGSYFHHANIGHLIKSRAALSQIYYNMITDGNDAESKASYEIDIPSGGQAILVGNIIQKSSTPENPHVISFAKEESNRYPVNQIFVCFNTIINFHNANDLVLGAPQSVTEKYIFNNAISENTTFSTSVQLTAEKGNVFFKPEEFSLSKYYPISSTVVESWKSRMEKGIDAYLPQDLKLKSISLVPRYQILPSLKVVPLDSEPSIPGAVQKMIP